MGSARDSFRPTGVAFRKREPLQNLSCSAQEVTLRSREFQKHVGEHRHSPSPTFLKESGSLLGGPRPMNATVGRIPFPGDKPLPLHLLGHAGYRGGTHLLGRRELSDCDRSTEDGH